MGVVPGLCPSDGHTEAAGTDTPARGSRPAGPASFLSASPVISLPSWDRQTPPDPLLGPSPFSPGQVSPCGPSPPALGLAFKAALSRMCSGRELTWPQWRPRVAAPASLLIPSCPLLSLRCP